MKKILRLAVPLVLLVFIAGCPKSALQLLKEAQQMSGSLITISGFSDRDLVGNHRYSYTGSGGGDIEFGEVSGRLQVKTRSYDSKYDGKISPSRNRIWIEDERLNITHNFAGHQYTWFLDKAYTYDPCTVIMSGKAKWSGAGRKLVMIFRKAGQECPK